MIDQPFTRPVRFTEVLEKWEPGSPLDGPPDSVETVVSWAEPNGTPITDEVRIAELNRERDAERDDEAV